MNSDVLSLMQSCIDRHRDVIAPGSIEETSLLTAANMFVQGQPDVAQQIIDSLLIDPAIKTECRAVFTTEETEEVTPDETNTTQSSVEPIDTAPIPAPIPEPAKEAFISEPLVASTPPAPVASPATEPHVMDVPTDVPTPPQASAPPQVQPLESDHVQDTLGATAPTLAPAENLEKPVFVEDPIPSTEIASPQEDIGVSKDIGLDNSVWDNFNAIVEEEKTRVHPSDETPSHTERVAQLSGELVEAGDEVETDQDKSITEDYDHVFGGDAHTSKFKAPGVIKTYAPAQSTIDKEQRQQESGKQDRLEKQKKYFDAGEQYLKRAYTSGNSAVMTSARAQFESLKERYPEYVTERSAHIADMQGIIDQHNTARAQAVMHESYQLNEDTLIAPGIRVSGDQDTYIITSIIQPTPDHDAEIVFTADTSKQIYHVPAQKLSAALVDPDLHTDEFFADFISEKK